MDSALQLAPSVDLVTLLQADPALFDSRPVLHLLSDNMYQVLYWAQELWMTDQHERYLEQQEVQLEQKIDESEESQLDADFEADVELDIEVQQEKQWVVKQLLLLQE